MTLDEFLSCLKPPLLKEGEHLIRQGNFTDELCSIESGEVNTMLETGNGTPARRLRRQGGGTVLGELGLLLKMPRLASVMVNRFATIFCLSETSLLHLKRERLEVAADFFEFLSRSLSERVLNTTKSLRVLTD